MYHVISFLQVEEGSKASEAGVRLGDQVRNFFLTVTLVMKTRFWEM